jgi:Ca2+-binding EF-hand superfamily protein
MSAITQGSHAASSCGDIIYDAFRFIDTDNSGELTKEELKDGFAALGVNLSESVSDQICEVSE